MNAKTLKALKGSIAKWEKIVAGTGVDRGERNCPLCKLFNNPHSDNRCFGCPVRERTQRRFCRRTAYTTWWKWGWEGSTAETAKQKRVATSMLRFLKSLLPRVKK